MFLCNSFKTMKWDEMKIKYTFFKYREMLFVILSLRWVEISVDKFNICAQVGLSFSSLKINFTILNTFLINFN